MSSSGRHEGPNGGSRFGRRLEREPSPFSGSDKESSTSQEEDSNPQQAHQSTYTVSLTTTDLDKPAPTPSPEEPLSTRPKSSLKKRPSALALQGGGANGSSRRRLSSASSTGSTSDAGARSAASEGEKERGQSPMNLDFSPVSLVVLSQLPSRQPNLILPLPSSKKNHPRARPVALKFASSSSSATASPGASVNTSAPNGSQDGQSIELPRTLLLPVKSAELGPPSALTLDATVEEAAKSSVAEDSEKLDAAVQNMDVDLPKSASSSLSSSSSRSSGPTFKLSPSPAPARRGLKTRSSALSLFTDSATHPDSASTTIVDLFPSPPMATIPLLLLPEGDSISSSPSPLSSSKSGSSAPTRNLLSLPPKPISLAPRVKPSPLALNFSNSSSAALSVNRPNLHISPSAPNLRQASTAALTPSESWAAAAPPPPSSLGRGKRNAKGLSLSLGFGSASPGSSSSESGAPPSPAPGSSSTGGARFSTRPPHTSIPPQTPSSSSHFQTSFLQGPPSSSASSQQSQRPNLLALLPTHERDPTDSSSSATRPYPDGPIEVLPGLFIGSEENARDWQALTSSKFNIGRVVNVAKELVGAGEEYGTAEEDQAMNQIRPATSTPNLRGASTTVSVGSGGKVEEKTYVLPNGKKMEYLHLPWSHGQADLVSGGEGGESGFTRAGEWVGEGLVRGEGVLVHCQCGISRSATLVIAIVMRLAAEGNMVEELGEVRGMHDAYEFVKKKSPWIGPNVSLIYQLLEWERLLAAQTSHLPQILSSNNSSDGSSVSTPIHRGFSTEVESEEDWSRRRAELEALEEAEEMDRAMEERKRSRTSSNSSTISSASSSAAAGPTAVNGSRRPSLIKRRVSGSSLASEITLEEDEDEDEDETGGYEHASEGIGSRTSPVSSDGLDEDGSSGMVVDGLGEEPKGVEAAQAEEVPQVPTRFSAPPTGSRAQHRKRSSTLSFIPSLDPLPSSPTTVTDPSHSTSSGSDAFVDGPPRVGPPPRSKSYQTHAQRASCSSLNEVVPASPLSLVFNPTSFEPQQPPSRSETPSSMTSSRRSSLSSFSRPPPILSSNEPPRSLQQLLFFPPSPNRSMDPSTPTMSHSISTFLSSPPPNQQTFASSSSSLGYQVASTSPVAEKTPTGHQRLRSMFPTLVSPTSSALPPFDDTPLAHAFGNLGTSQGGGGGFGSNHSPKQRKDLHRKTFSLDVKSLIPSSSFFSPSSPSTTFPDPPQRARAPSAGVLGGNFAFGRSRSRTPSISSVNSSQGGGGSQTSSRRSSIGMMPAPSTPTIAVTEFNARGYVDSREMK